MSSTFFLEPTWLGLDSDGTLELIDFGDGTTLSLTGRARAAVLDGKAAQLATLSAVDPTVARLREHLERYRKTALDRATVLRGSGFHQLFVELTARCNERCAHCYAESSPERSEALSEKTILEVLDDARALDFQVVQLTGGDPLVSEHCATAAEHCKKLGFPTLEVYTNGVALDGRLYERLLDAGASFAFSFYSHDPLTHDAITRTPKSQARTVRAIRRVVADGLELRVNMIVMDRNQGDVEATYRFLEDLGVPPENIGMDVQREVGRGLYTLEAKNVRSPVKAGGTHRTRTQKDGLPFRGRATVSYDGTVYPCIFSRMFALGSVHEARLTEILTREVPVRAERARVLDARRTWCSSLACWDCQIRASLLEPAVGPYSMKRAAGDTG